MDIHANRFFSTASNSTLYGSVPYMETLPRTKGGRGVILSTYIFELGINTIVNQFINNLDGLIIRIQNLLILYLFLPL